MQTGSRRLKKVQEGAVRSMKAEMVLEGSRKFKKVQEGLGRFKKVEEGGRGQNSSFEKIPKFQEGSRRAQKI